MIKKKTISLNSLRKARDKHNERFTALRNVIGTGLGEKKTKGGFTRISALIVFVSKKVPKHGLGKDRVPIRVKVGEQFIRTDVVSSLGFIINMVRGRFFVKTTPSMGLSQRCQLGQVNLYMELPARIV